MIEATSEMMELRRQDEMVPTSSVFTQTRNSLGVFAAVRFMRLQELS